MLRLTEVIKDCRQPSASLSLPIEKRIKGRLRAELDDGREVGLFLPRGLTLRHGDRLGNEDGLVVEIKAAPEQVSSVYCADLYLLARACYHLGNRHVPLQIEPGMVRYQHDHVLDDMLRGLGLEVTAEQAPFEPEDGAYGGQSGGHSHGHSHGDSHAH